MIKGCVQDFCCHDWKNTIINLEFWTVRAAQKSVVEDINGNWRMSTGVKKKKFYEFRIPKDGVSLASGK